MQMKIFSRRIFIKSLFSGLFAGALYLFLPFKTFAGKDSSIEGIEIEKGFVVFDNETQKTMEHFAIALIPQSKEINIKEKLFNIIKKNNGIAAFLDAGFWNIDALSKTKYNKHFYELENKEDINHIVEYVKVSNPLFFGRFRKMLFDIYFTDKKTWQKLS